MAMLHLAPRRQVMALVVSGLLNKQVGGELGISEITVKPHRGQVMRKMNAESLPGLVTIGRAPRRTFGADWLTVTRPSAASSCSISSSSSLRQPATKSTYLSINDTIVQ
jgi:DNA-binding CsgD family transcriptional regulator